MNESQRDALKEPTVDELLGDPIAGLLIASDRIATRDVLLAVETARAALASRPPTRMHAGA